MALTTGDITDLGQPARDTTPASSFNFTITTPGAGTGALCSLTYRNDTSSAPTQPTVTICGVAATVLGTQHQNNSIADGYTMLCYAKGSWSGTTVAVDFSGDTQSWCGIQVLQMSTNVKLTGTNGGDAIRQSTWGTGSATPMNPGTFGSGFASGSLTVIMFVVYTGAMTMTAGSWTLLTTDIGSTTPFNESGVQATEVANPTIAFSGSTSGWVIWGLEIAEATAGGLGIPLAMHHYTKNLRG